MLQSYLPALVFVFLGVTIGMAFAFLGKLLGPRRAIAAKREPYE
jgi:NADH:ubiquinone oxidoreductase subunit 3 (subunit A)